MDSRASSHVTGKTGNLANSHSTLGHNSQHIIIGNGSHLPIVVVGTVQISSLPLYLQDVLVSPSIVKNLISVRKFTRDNFVSIEFDPYGFSVKDLATRTLLLRSNSDGDLYPFLISTTSNPTAAFTTSSGNLWHQRLDHPSNASLAHLPLDFLQCNNNVPSSSPLCEACQLGRQPRIPFPTSTSRTSAEFQLIHCDLWTSPILSFSGYKYYLGILDDFTHYSWTFPLCAKTDTCATIQRFFQFIHTQFHVTIQCMQCDNGGEFLTTTLRDFFSSHGVSFRLSCPHTSPQNGKAERLLRTTNDIIRTLLIHAKLPPPFWVEALHTATHLLNLRPSRAIKNHTPHYSLFGVHPSYEHLRVFGCLCYPNLYATSDHKLSPRSSLCVFLGYPREHKGYRYLDLSSRRIIVSRHVIFDESTYPYFSPNNAASATDNPTAGSPDLPRTDTITSGIPTAPFSFSCRIQTPPLPSLHLARPVTWALPFG
jgi:histone deacetylase 1/2